MIRPYKGLEDLIRAFDMLDEREIERFRLTVVGETWENWTLPAECIATSRYRDRITFVNRYVDDKEVARVFDQADGVVLPYRHSSSSGALHIAQSYGLPVVVTRVGGLVEAVNGYDGALLVPPYDLEALCDALRWVQRQQGLRFVNPRSWERIVADFSAYFGQLLAPIRPERHTSAIPVCGGQRIEQAEAKALMPSLLSTQPQSGHRRP